jgi:beta-ureidopropionase
MSDKVKIGLIQASHNVHEDQVVEVHKAKAINKHITLIREVKKSGAQIVRLQEIFFDPYF